MQDLRIKLGVKCVQWKIENKELEKIGHVLSIRNDRRLCWDGAGNWKVRRRSGAGKGRLCCNRNDC